MFAKTRARCYWTPKPRAWESANAAPVPSSLSQVQTTGRRGPVGRHRPASYQFTRLLRLRGNELRKRGRIPAVARPSVKVKAGHDVTSHNCRYITRSMVPLQSVRSSTMYIHQDDSLCELGYASTRQDSLVTNGEDAELRGSGALQQCPETDCR